MARCTAPVYGHRTASTAANCPARAFGRTTAPRPTTLRRPGPPGALAVGRLLVARPAAGRPAAEISTASWWRFRSYTAAEWRTIEPLARQAEVQAREHPERRDLFLCHAGDDREGAARELCDLLVSLGATVWFSENDVGLGKSLLREIDRGLANSRNRHRAVDPGAAEEPGSRGGLPTRELSALLATDRVIPVAHSTTFEALRDVSPLLAAWSGPSTRDSSMRDVATKVAAAAAAEDDI